MMCHALGLLALLATMLPPGKALAARPAECSSADAIRGYGEGYALEKRVLGQLWSGRQFTCSSLETFVDAINVPIEPSTGWDDYLSCRNAGIANAIQSNIRERHDECGKNCTDSGASIGELTGEQFCNVYRAPQFQVKSMYESYEGPRVCTVFTQQGCQVAFASFVDRTCPSEKQAQREKYNALMETACKTR